MGQVTLTDGLFVLQIPGGRKFDSAVVNGFVCTKNIAHKKVRQLLVLVLAQHLRQKQNLYWVLILSPVSR